MSGPRILVIGAGSIGSRHAANLVALGADVTVTDPHEARARATGLPNVTWAADALAGYDGIVVASPTALHEGHARAALAAGSRVLLEKPPALSVAGMDELSSLGGDRLMVAYNLRFHRPVQRVVERVESGAIGRIVAVRVWFGSWLPGWRPNVDYRTTYSANASLGGGVLLDASHELDLLVWVLGPGRFSVVGAVLDRLGSLDIDVEDTVRALLRHESGTIAEVSLDYLSRAYRRGIEVVGTEATVRFDWARSVVETEDGEGVHQELDKTPISRSYELEAEHFAEFVQGRQPALVDGLTGAASVRLVDAIRHAAAT